MKIRPLRANKGTKIFSNKNVSILSIAAVVAVAGILFASTYSQSQMTATKYGVSTVSGNLIQKISDMGGIEL